MTPLAPPEQKAIPAETSPGLPEPGGARAPLCFALLCVVQATLIFTITFITIPLPRIGAEFAVSSSGMLLILAAYGLPYSGLLLFGGRLSDRYRGRRMLPLGLLVFGFSSAVGAFAPSYEILVAMRFMQGVGAAAVAPAAVAVLRDLYPEPGRFGRAMAVWGSVSVLGATLGFVTGAITLWVSWRWLFVTPTAVALGALLLGAILLPAARAQADRLWPGLDAAGAFLATAAISALSFGIIASGEYGWRSNLVVVSLSIGLLALFAFVQVEKRVSSPLLPGRFLKNGARIFGLLAMFLAACSSGLVKFVSSLYLQQSLGWSPLETAGGFVPYAVVLVAMSFFSAGIVKRFGASGVTSAALLLTGLGFFLLSGLSPDTSFVQEILPGLLMVAFGSSLAFAGAAVLSMASTTADQAGLAGGVMNTAMELGPTAGLAMVMAVAAIQAAPIDGYAWAFGTAAAAFLLAGGAGFAAQARRRSPGETSTMGGSEQ